MTNVLTLLAKSVLIPLGLTVVPLVTDAAIEKKIYGLGITALINSNEETADIMKKVKSLEKFSFLIEGVYKIIENEAKEQKKCIF